MTTPRVTIEELILDTAPTTDFEFLAHRTSDNREIRVTLASMLALVSVMTSGFGWTIATTAPTGPTLGQGWFDSANGEFRIWTGTLWELIGPLSTGGFNDATARMLANQALTAIATINGMLPGLANPAAATQTEAEAGTEPALRSWSPERVGQAITALSGNDATARALANQAIASIATINAQLPGLANPAAVTQTEAEEGLETALRSWSPQRVAQAIAALETGHDSTARMLANNALTRVAALEAISRTDDDVTTLARAVAQAAAGGTQTGITMAWNAADHTYTLTVSGSTPPPTPGTVNVTYGIAPSAGGTISPAQMAVATLGVAANITLPAPTAAGMWWAMNIPAGHMFSSIRSSSFPGIELSADWLATPDALRAEIGPSRAGAGTLDMLVTIVEVP